MIPLNTSLEKVGNFGCACRIMCHICGMLFIVEVYWTSYICEFDTWFCL